MFNARPWCSHNAASDRVLLVRVQGSVDRGAPELLPGLVELLGHDGAQHVPGVLCITGAYHAQGLLPLSRPDWLR